MTEKNYIKYRKLKAACESICYYVCRIFPIKNNLISVCTFEGKGGFGCNPKYIVEELHRKDPQYQFVWLVNKNAWDKEFPDYIKKVNNSSIWCRAYWLSRSKIWIDNYRKPLGTKKRKNQYYLNTNHFTIGIKCTGLLRGIGFSEMARLVNQNDSDMMDALVTDSELCEITCPKGMLYDGPYLRTGAPRCDVLYGKRDIPRAAFRKKHGLPENAKVVMFAPTFREGAKDGKRFVYSEEWTLDFDRLLDALEKRFGGNWYICLRVHPQLAASFKDKKNKNSRIIDESQADDMYEILAAMDFYITDYSSAIFEAGFAKIPAIIYADDIQKYEHDRGQLMWNIATDALDHVTNNKKVLPELDLVFPFSIATNNEEMEELINSFQIFDYEGILDRFHREIGLTFNGDAGQRMSCFIEKEIGDWPING